MTIFVGIDPGVTGAIAAVDSRGCAVVDLPTVAIPGTGMVKRRLCGRGLAEILRRFVPPGEVAFVVLEDVHTMPGLRNSPQTQGSLMQSKGIVQGVLDTMSTLEVRLVNAQTWKRLYGVGADKDLALETARKLYPNAEHLLARKKDHNRAEALLLAHFGKVKLA